jgi:hypothetical protein
MTLPLRAEGSVVGRDAELVIPNATLSRRHARTWWHGESWWVEDCGSKNGTMVNGRRIESAEPDRLAFGAVECQVVLAGQEQIPRQSPVSQHEPAARSTLPTQPMPAGRTETTRYLCAASHLDEEFGRRVIRHTVEESYRAVAPSLGVDVATVARHALAARRRRFIRDLFLLVVLLGAMFVIAVQLTRPEARAALLAWDAGTARLLLSALPLDLLVFGVLAVLVIAGEAWVTRYLVLGKQLSHRSFRPDAITAPMGRRARDRLARVAASEYGNVTIFRGFHPFVGCGLQLQDWSFAVDISKGCLDAKTGERKVPRAFDAADLHDYLGDALRGLAMPGLIVTDRLFINGKDIWQDQRLLPDRKAAPVITVPHAVVREMLRESNPVARPYLCAEASGWHGQLVQTTFLRAVRFRDSLYVEGVPFVLLPLRGKFHAVDTLVPCGPVEALMASLGRAVVRLVPLLLASPVRVLRAVAEERQRRIISNGWHFDYGATASIREIASGIDTRRYFLESDVDMFLTVVRERLLNGIVDFLGDHDVDTKEAKGFQQTINNNMVNSSVNFGDSKGGSVFGQNTNNFNQGKAS